MESANVVGYQNIPINNGYSFRTVTFKNISQTNFDLTDITPLKSTGEEFDSTGGSGKVRVTGNIVIQKVGVDGAFLQEYRYYSTKTGGVLDGWQRGAKEAKLNPGDVTFAPGEGMIINCTVANGANFRVSGEVDLVDNTTTIPQGYSFAGNSTPVEIDLLDIHPLKPSGEEFDSTGGSGKVRVTGNIVIQKVGTDGAFLQEYRYYSTKTGGVLDDWQLGAKTAKVQRGDLTFAPGEGFIINCTVAGGAKLQLPSPIKSAE